MNTMSALATHPAAHFLSENTMRWIARRMANHLAQDGRTDEFELAPSHERVMMVATHYIEDWYNSLNILDLIEYFAESDLHSGLLRAQHMLWAEMLVHLLKSPTVVRAIDQHRQAWLKNPTGYDTAPFSASCELLSNELRTDEEKFTLQCWAATSRSCGPTLDTGNIRFCASTDHAFPAMARALRLCFPSPWDWTVEAMRDNYWRAALIMQEVGRGNPGPVVRTQVIL